MKTRSLLTCLLALTSLLGLTLSSRAASLVVTNLADSGPGSLRDAIASANTNADADVITFEAALDGQIILLDSQFVLSNQLTIDASELTNGIVITPAASANLSGPPAPGQRIFEVAASSTVELDHLTIQGGFAYDSTSAFSPASGINPVGSGGGILTDAGAGTLTLNNCVLSGNYAEYGGGAIAIPISSNFALNLSNCTVSGNVALEGGGVFNEESSGGTVIINNSTFSGNTAIFDGGGTWGLATFNNSTFNDNHTLRRGGGAFRGAKVLHVNNCTISGNSAFLSAGGIAGRSLVGFAVLSNSIVAGNIAPTNSEFNFNLGQSLSSLTSGNPLLAPLGNYGGPTFTMPPLAGSPAIDAGDDSITNSLATDQRGFPRLSGAHVDIGAVELQVMSNAPVLMNPTKQPGGALSFNFTSSPDADFTVLATTNVALARSQWTILAPATQESPGQYQFTDPFAPSYPRRFYQVVSP